MEEQTLDIVEILGLILFLGSLVYLVGISFQLFISIRQDKKFKFKQLILILSTHMVSVVATYLIWTLWNFGMDLMFGPILLPALVSELLLAPIFLRIFKYKLKIKKPTANSVYNQLL
jgi:hypothetical protein